MGIVFSELGMMLQNQHKCECHGIWHVIRNHIVKQTNMHEQIHMLDQLYDGLARHMLVVLTLVACFFFGFFCSGTNSWQEHVCMQNSDLLFST